ncbi:hypothetical protein BN1723_004421 [Verticillium longisporum]|uniref:Uncharacterized protein n=1 Tax=Verticillium longisporum TaxID=100787 RepID=A0A0G4MX94_VERLO|nr:hypothetical protein BN1723_004421 [Verticillium longisporum]
MTTFESWQHNAAALLPTRRPRQLLILIGAFLVTLLLVSVSLAWTDPSPRLHSRTQRPAPGESDDHGPPMSIRYP